MRSRPYGKLVHLEVYGDIPDEGEYCCWRTAFAFYEDGSIVISDFYREDATGPWARENHRLYGDDPKHLDAGLRRAVEKGWRPGEEGEHASEAATHPDL